MRAAAVTAAWGAAAGRSQGRPAGPHAPRATGIARSGCRKRPARSTRAAPLVVAVATPAPLGLEAVPGGGAERRWSAAGLLAGAAAAVVGAAVAAGALPGAVPALAAAALQRIDPHVLGATVGASFKLSLICCLVGWLLRSKQIPGTAAPVLSKVRGAQGWRGDGTGRAAPLLRCKSVAAKPCPPRCSPPRCRSPSACSSPACCSAGAARSCRPRPTPASC